MSKMPHYLTVKLAALKFNDGSQINQANYLTIFAQLKCDYPSLSYQALYDLYNLVFASYPDKELQQQLIRQYKALPARHTAVDPQLVTYYLAKAHELAKQALLNDEIPIGAVVVYQNEIIGRGYNQTKLQNNILAHAEIIAIQQAQQYLDNHRLAECDLYVTIEPCLMCSGAIINSRIKRVFFAANEPKTGACISQYKVFENTKVNHNTQIIGPLNPEYALIVQEFLLRKRT